MDGFSAAPHEDVLVLVVDDDPDVLEATAELLQADGYRVSTATLADEALAQVAAQQPMCVILDLNLPGVGGVEVATQIRAAHGSDIVLIVLTASPLPAEHAAAEAAGVDHVLRKPLNIDRLRRMLPRLV